MKKLMMFLVGLPMVLCAADSAAKVTSAWIDDYEAALKRAAAEKKLVLCDFSGSDWCGWCQKLDREVFAKPEFIEGASKKYVLLLVDSPRDEKKLSEKARKQNPKLVEKYEIDGFPSVLLLNAKGEKLAECGYQEGGPVKYLEMLERELREAPDVAKHIKPIEAVLDVAQEACESELEKFTKRADARLKKPGADAAEARAQNRADLAQVYAKIIPPFERAFAKARAMKVPANMEARKTKLIGGRQECFDAMKEELQDSIGKKDGKGK